MCVIIPNWYSLGDQTTALCMLSKSCTHIPNPIFKFLFLFQSGVSIIFFQFHFTIGSLDYIKIISITYILSMQTYQHYNKVNQSQMYDNHTHEHVENTVKLSF